MEKTIGKYKIEVEQDEYARDPREDDNLGTMVCFSRNYNWGDKHDYSDPDEFADFVKENIKKIITLPLYVYVHSGTTMRTTPFGDPWDSWCVGRIYITKEKVRKEFGWKHITKAREQKIRDYLRGEVETYDQYLTGDVYGYRITDKETNEEVDSCWGFYGEDYCMKEATGITEYMIETDKHGQLELNIK